MGPNISFQTALGLGKYLIISLCNFFLFKQILILVYSFIYIHRFIPSTLAAHAIRDAIKAQYEQPWPLWHDIPLQVHERMFHDFKVIMYVIYYYLITIYKLQII